LHVVLETLHTFVEAAQVAKNHVFRFVTHADNIPHGAMSRKR